jgi:hypothetical protein
MTAELVEIRPTTRSDLDVVQRFATAAVRLPNGHPWHLRPVDQGFEIRADHARAARSTGLGARTVRLAVGAALFNVRLAVAVLGHQPVVSWSLDGPRSYVVAVVRRGVQRGPAPVERALFAAIASDGSAGSRSGGPASAAAVLAHARRAAEAEGVWLRGVAGPDRDRLARSLPGVVRPAHVVVIGGNHDVAGVHLRAGLALQRLVLTARALGWRASVAAWPADLAAVPHLPRTIGGPGLWPQVVVALDRPSDGSAPDRP